MENNINMELTMAIKEMYEALWNFEKSYKEVSEAIAKVTPFLEKLTK